MNRTPRGLNRLLLALVGLLLLVAGTLTAAAGLNLDIARAWTRTAADTWAWVLQQFRSAPLADTGISWWTVAILGVLVLAILLLLGWILSQGRGRSDQIGARRASVGTGTGTTTVDASLAARAIRETLASEGQVLSTRASSWKIKGRPGIKMEIQARKGASPRQIATTAEDTITGLDTLLGEQLPTLVHIRAGTRTRFTRSEHLH